MIGRRKDFTFGQGHVLFSAGNNKNGLFATNGGFDVGVGFGT